MYGRQCNLKLYISDKLILTPPRPQTNPDKLFAVANKSFNSFIISLYPGSDAKPKITGCLKLLEVALIRGLDQTDRIKTRYLLQEKVSRKDFEAFVSQLILNLPCRSIFGTAKVRGRYIRYVIRRFRKTCRNRFIGGINIKDVERSKLKEFVEEDQSVIEIFYFELTKHVVLPLIKNVFYIFKIGCSFQFIGILKWEKMQTQSFLKFSDDFVEIDEANVFSLHQTDDIFGVYPLRFYQKPNGGIRIISLLNAKINLPNLPSQRFSINQKLTIPCAVLHAVVADTCHSFKMSMVKGKQFLKKNLLQYSKSLVKRNKDCFYLSFDVERCYDRMDVPIIWKALSWATWKPYYHIFKVRKSHPAIRKSYFYAVSSSHSTHFSERKKTELLFKKFHSSEVNVLKYDIIENHLITTAIKRFTTKSLIFHNGKYYKRKQGIPQGAKISTSLCALYLQYIFKDIQTPELTKIFIAADDFLFISPDKKFLDKIMNYVKSSSVIKLNSKKTQQSSDNVGFIKFYGLQIDSKSLKIK